MLYQLVIFFLSSYGQNLSTSTFIGETSFAILIAILGLVLFAHLIGNMQVLFVWLFPHYMHCFITVAVVVAALFIINYLIEGHHMGSHRNTL